MARDGQPPRLHPTGPTVSVTFLIRVVALACVAVVGSGWALVRYYTHPRQPMQVPIPVAPDAGPRGGGEEWGDAAVIPAPEIELAPR